MATNAEDEEVKEETLDTSAEDLRKAKEESETNTDTSSASEEEPTKGEESQEESKDDSTLTTEPQEHDLAWYQKAYEESTKEALRLKGELEKTPPPPVIESTKTEDITLTASELYIKQKQDEEIATAFADIVKNYPQVKDPEDYKKFTAMANTFGKTILDAEGRLATPKELYSNTVIALGWTADDSKEQLGAALKDGAGSPRISSGAGQGSSTSKVTDEMISINRKMYPGKTDAQIREELEPHVQ